MKGFGGKENRVLPENNRQTRDREFKPSDYRIRDSDDESDVYLYLLSRLWRNLKKKRLDKLQKLYHKG